MRCCLPIYMVCHHYGLRISLDELDGLCVGMSMLGLKESAQCLGFECRAFKVPISVLGQLQLPCLLHWNQNHYVVLYGLNKSGKKFKIADPGKGLISYTKKEIENHWLSSVQR